MGLIWSDGFDAYGASADLARNWTGGGTGWAWSSSAGRFGAGSIQTVTTAKTLITPVGMLAIAGTAQIGILFWLKASTAPSSTFQLISCQDSGNANRMELSINTSGVPVFTANAGVITTGATNVCDNNFHWIEWVANHNGNISNRCYVDGTVQWNGSFAIGNQVTDHIVVASPATGTWTIDDLFMVDASGVSPKPADMPIGQRQIDTRFPTSDGTVQFTTSTGTSHFALVDEVAANDDTDYVQDNISGHQDVFGMSALGFTPTSITSVQLVSRVKNPSGGTQTFKHRCHSGATNSDGTTLTAAAGYVNNRSFYDQDPNTSAAWTASNLGNAQFGLVLP